MRGGWKDRILRKTSSRFSNNFELAGSGFQFLTTFDVVNIFTQSNDNHRGGIGYVIILGCQAFSYSVCGVVDK